MACRKYSDSKRRQCSPDGFGTGDSVKSEYETDRYFLAAQLDGFYNIGNVSIGASTGVLLAQEWLYSFTESDDTRVSGRTIELGSYNIGATGSYFIDISRDLFAAPYVSYRYDTEFAREQALVTIGDPFDGEVEEVREYSHDHDGHTAGAGVNLYIGNNMSGGLDFQTVPSRRKQKIYSGTASFRVQF